MLRWVLWGADLLLLGLTTLLILTNPGRPSMLIWVVCLLALGVGALLGLTALLAGPRN